MAPQADIEKPSDDPFSLMGSNWPSESEGAYHAAELNADALSTATTTQAESADDAERKMASESGKTAEAVAGGYGAVAERLRGQSRDYTTISSWMLDAGGKVGKAKSQIADLVSTGTNEIREALGSELAGKSVSPSSSDLTAKYRADIAHAASTLTADLDGIGHSLQGDPGSSRTPSYTSVPAIPSTERPDPRAVVTAYNSGQHPVVEPQKLPEMPRAKTAEHVESPSATTTPTSTVNPTLANLIGVPQGNASPSSTPASPSAKSSSATTGTPAAQQQAHQQTEQHQPTKSHGLPNIPSIPLPDLPTAAQNITTAVTSAVGSQLPAAAPATSTPGSSAPASTGITPGVSGTPPVTPVGLAPIGGVPTPTVQAPPVPQGTPGAPAPTGLQAPSATQAPTPAAPRGPVADAAWIQRAYGLAPGLDVPRNESPVAPVCFIVGLPEPEVHLHKVLASLRHVFEQSGWSQPLAVASIRRGFETRTVFCTSDALSIHPHGVSLPAGVSPLDEMSGSPNHSELSGSLMVTDKLTSLIPRGWEVEGVLSTVPGAESHQSIEQYQALVDAGELLECNASRGRSDVTDDEALRVFARAAIGSAGCSDLDTENNRIRAARWVGVQPVGYGEVLARWYLSDAAESMSEGRWSEAVYASEKYLSVVDTKSQAA